ncbi:DUF3631 domain-containing protein [Mycobacterium marinum]|uniref:DUF3631 domain-containing protein n=1 Tax=Mycobacterium marinum TaxID=1781 RepID=UPI00235869FA|nr:DUF3631 domain-containing protein [Mycobacterium marinum]MDC8970835.1 DUF3631 domain-containing protein [Mycobacterium marinum]
MSSMFEDPVFRDDPEKDDGAELLDELHDAIGRYVILPDSHATVGVTLWIATTHALPAFDFAPRLAIVSPQKRCGKTRLLDVIEHTAHNPLATSNATVAALFRSIGGGHPPCLIFDEADTIFGSKRLAEQHEDLRNLFNNGFQRGRETLRCVGPSQTPVKFPIFAMAALAGIGTLPDTITDRAINVTMRRRAPGETVKPFRLRRDGPLLESLRFRLAEWAAGQLDALTDAQPDLPVEDREADTWEPLIAVADAAGGRWPELARGACKALTEGAAAADEAQSLGVTLLSDIRDVFDRADVAFLSSTELVAALRKVDESPWADFDLNPRKLAQRLKPFGVGSTRDSAGDVRGYRLDTFCDPFGRYLRQDASGCVNTVPDQRIPADASLSSDTSIRQAENTCQTITAAQEPYLTFLTDSDGIAAESVPSCRYCGGELKYSSARSRGHCSRPDCSKAANKDREQSR